VPTFTLRRARIGLAAALLAACSSTAAAQGTALVPPSDLAYMDVDRLSELGVLDSVVIGQRPYSRREFGRIVRIARARLDGGSSGLTRRLSDDALVYAEGVLRRLQTRFAEESEDQPIEAVVFAPLDGASLTASSTDADRRGFFSPYSQPLEATIDPLAVRRLGRPALRGHTAALELSQRLEPTGWLAFQARERLEIRRPRDTTLTRRDGELLLASARARFRNVALTVGRQQFTWAQSAGDGLFLASDAPALDQVSLAGDHPFVLPGFLRRLGSTQATLIFADLGTSVARSHSKLLAYKVSVQPASSFELGGTFMNHFGGSGSPSTSLGNRLIDFLPFIDIFRKHNYTDPTRTMDVESDKLLGIDSRLRIDPLGGILLTGEVLIDDFDVHRIPKLFTGYGSSNVAITIPRIGGPFVSAKLSAKHMGILTYTHGQLSNGITTRGRLLGDELGPDAKAFSAELRWDPGPAARFTIEGRSAIYSNATYTAFYSDSAQTRFVVQKVSHTADELRDRLLGTMILQTEDGIALTVRAGGERTRNYAFSGGRRTDYMAEIALRLGQ
jgi:hypothetical protein